MRLGRNHRLADKLDQLAPNSPAAVALRVRWLDAKKQGSQIEALLERTGARLLKGNDQQTQPTAEQKIDSCVTVGDLYFSVKQYAAAERWYQRAYKLDRKYYGRLARSAR